MNNNKNLYPANGSNFTDDNGKIHRLGEGQLNIWEIPSANGHEHGNAGGNGKHQALAQVAIASVVRPSIEQAQA